MLKKSQYLLLSVLVLFLNFSAALSQQNPATDEEILSVKTNLVTVPVSVSDKSGRFIANLKPDDFRLSENGVEQEIAFFSNEKVPFTVALLVDVSESTKYDFADIQKSAAAFVDQLRAQDKVMLVAFNKSAAQLSEPTNDKDLLKKRIAEMRQGGATSVYDALDYAVEKLGKIRGRKAVVLLSDGVDTSSRTNLESSLRSAAELDALVYTIRYETLAAVNRDFAPTELAASGTTQIVTARGENLKTAYARAALYLESLATNSGGRYFLAASPANLVKTFVSIAEELRTQYSIGYYPKDESAEKEKRRIKVVVGSKNGGDVVVKARKFYFYKNAADDK